VSLLVASLGTGMLPQPVRAHSELAQPSASVGGTVFRDVNANGVLEVTASPANPVAESGIGGVIVSAFAAGSATAVVTTSSASNGVYLLSGLTSGQAYRIEFSAWSADDEASVRGNAGVASGTSVQFAVAGSGAAVNFAVQAPCEYCQAEPAMYTTMFRNGDALGGGSMSSKASAAVFPYFATLSTGAQTTPTLQADTGSTWGLAFQRETRTVFASAFMKRHAGLGPLGLGGIYSITLDSASTPSTFASGQLVNLSALGVNVGTDPRRPGDLPADMDIPNHDPNAFDAVGKTGLGDIDLSEDGRTLWATNLFERTLLEIRIGNPAVTPSAAAVTSHALPSIACVQGVLRPFATRVYKGRVYVGAVCSGENGSSSANLRAYVLQHDPAGANSNFSTVLDIPLDYSRSFVTAPPQIPGAWLPWIDSWDDIGDPTRGPNDAQTIWPQPILSDLEFDNGGMILGFSDRMSHQGGHQNYSTVSTDTVLYDTVSGGDLLRACLQSNGGYQLESNGACGGQQGGPADSGQGPDNGEFYHADAYFGSHTEVMLGGLATYPGLMQIGAAAFNPNDTTFDNSSFQQGVRWLNSASPNVGASTRTYQLSASGGYGDSSYFGKAAGIGDLEVLCNPAPIEIGNRVWNDANADGIQDAGEAALSTVTVRLTLADGSTYAAQTNGLGEYLFSSAPIPDSPNANYDVPLRPGSAFTLTIDPAQGALAGLALTADNSSGDSSNDRITDIRDSDGVMFNGSAVITGQLGTSGQNNHGLDFGWMHQLATATPTSTSTSTPTATPTSTSTPTATPTSTSTSAPTATPTSTSTSTPTATPTSTATPTATPTSTSTSAPTSTPTSTLTSTPTATPTATPTSTSTSAPTATPTSMPTATPSSTSTALPQTAGLGDRVWLDRNEDGLQGTDEPGVSGVSVTLSRLGRTGALALVERQLTSAGGQYQFLNLAADVPYRVCFELPPGLRWTTPGAGTDRGLDSDATPQTGCAPAVQLSAGEYNASIDVGLVAPITLSKDGRGSGANGSLGSDNLITYTLRVRNTSNAIVSGVVVSDPLPSTMRYVPGSASPAPAGDAPLTWRLDDLAAGVEQTIVFAVRVTNGSQLVYVNTAYAGIVDIRVANDSAQTVRGPTDIQLARLSVSRVSDSTLRVQWRTLRESNTLGFHVLRGTSADTSQASRISMALIPATSANGAAYEFVDSSGTPGAAVHYWLREIELDGTWRDYGPVTPAGSVATAPEAVVFAGPVAAPAFVDEALKGVNASDAQTRQQIAPGANVVLDDAAALAADAAPVSIAASRDEAPTPGSAAVAPEAAPKQAQTAPETAANAAVALPAAAVHAAPAAVAAVHAQEIAAASSFERSVKNESTETAQSPEPVGLLVLGLVLAIALVSVCIGVLRSEKH
jgi:uncharacterized repeat protein (TIGR01451 family)